LVEETVSKKTKSDRENTTTTSDETILDKFDDIEVNITNDIEKYMKIPNDFRLKFMKKHPHINFNTREGNKRLHR